MVHPSGNKLKDFVEGLLAESDARGQIAAHLAECEFCREICDNYRLQKETARETGEIPLSPAAAALANQLYNSALQSLKIELIPLPVEKPSALYMAADGNSEKTSGVKNLATFYSENPEMILRVMRDFDHGADYLQLTGNEPALTSNILLILPEHNREFVTDNDGRVSITESLPQAVESLKWQIKMPEASFSLEPLKYDPEAVKYQSDMVLETDRKDRIKVTFEGKTEGKQIKINILALDGKTDFDTVKVMVGQKNGQELKKTRGSETVSFDIKEPGNEIKIRIFQ